MEAGPVGRLHPMQVPFTRCVLYRVSRGIRVIVLFGVVTKIEFDLGNAPPMLDALRVLAHERVIQQQPLRNLVKPRLVVRHVREVGEEIAQLLRDTLAAALLRRVSIVVRFLSLIGACFFGHGLGRRCRALSRRLILLAR